MGAIWKQNGTLCKLMRSKSITSFFEDTQLATITEQQPATVTEQQPQDAGRPPFNTGYYTATDRTTAFFMIY